MAIKNQIEEIKENVLHYRTDKIFKKVLQIIRE